MARGAVPEAPHAGPSTPLADAPRPQRHQLLQPYREQNLSPTLNGVGQNIIGSSDGWLISVSDDVLEDEDIALHMFEPLSGTHLRLPSITTLPYINHILWNTEGRIEFCLMNNGKSFSPTILRHCIFYKIVVSPSISGSFMVAAIWDKYLTFTTVGDQSWRSVKIPLIDGSSNNYCDKRNNILNDIIFYREQLYVVRRSGEVLACDLSADAPIATLVLPPPSPPRDIGHYVDNLKYLVESSDGRLLQVWMQTVQRPWPRVGRKPHMKVFAVKSPDNKGENEYWAELESLGEEDLFLGLNHSMALADQGFPELKRNCIYFVDNYQSRWGFSCFPANTICDLGVYNMEDRTFMPYFEGEYRIRNQPIWFTPKVLAVPDL